MWSLFEPVHVVTYFTPQALRRARRGRPARLLAGLLRRPRGAAGRGVGRRRCWPRSSASHPSMVNKAMPSVWTLVSPEAALQARVDGAVAALTVLLADERRRHVAEVVELLEAGRRPRSNRPGACSARPTSRSRRTSTRWHGCGRPPPRCASTAATATSRPWSRPASARSRRSSCAAAWTSTGAWLQPARGWTDEEWARRPGPAGRPRAARRGRGHHRRRARPGAGGRGCHRRRRGRRRGTRWARPGVRRLTELLTPMARKCIAVLPPDNPIGLSAVSARLTARRTLSRS